MFDRFKLAGRTGLAVLAIGTLAVLGVPGCSSGERSSTTPTGEPGPVEVSLALDWFPNSNHAGIYAAMKAGYFEAEGLDVNVYTPADPASVLQSIGAGRDDFGISYQTDLLEARNAGVPVVSVAAIVQHPLNSVMTLKSSGITRPADLRGKKIGYPGIPSNEGLLATMLESDGLTMDDVQLIGVGFDLTQPLAAGTVDAIIGAYWTHESIALELEGYPVNVMRMEEWGVPDFYELVLVASEETVTTRPDVVQKMVTAFKRGFDHAIANPQASIDTLVELGGDGVLEDVERRGVELLVPMWDDGAAPGFGWQTPERWESYTAWMKKRGLVEAGVDATAAYTNRFIQAATE